MGVWKTIRPAVYAEFPDNIGRNYDGAGKQKKKKRIIHFLNVSLEFQKNICPNGNGGLNRGTVRVSR